jgi:multidrug transporter EmrE-like cation transporter
MSNLLKLFTLSISSTLYIYFLKIYANTKNIVSFVLFLFFLFAMLFLDYSLFSEKKKDFFLIVIFIKVVPIILLALIDFFIFKGEFTILKVIGILLIIFGIILME